jgi:hypothetical protein
MITHAAFHVISGSEAAVFLIKTLELRDGEINRRNAAEALEWASTNQAELYARWMKYSEEES